MIRTTLLVLSFLTLAACSSTTVHLYGKFLSEDQIKTMSNELEQQGFKVEANSLAFPDNIEENAFVYSPFIKDRTLLTRLEDSLDKLNWPVSQRLPLTSGNHWYGDNSIGLFLLPEGVKPHLVADDLAGAYYGEQCNDDVVMHLLTQNQYRVEYKDKARSALEGTWRIISFPYVEISTTDKDWPMYYEISKQVKRDQVGLRESITLAPMKKRSIFPSCHFVNGSAVQ